MMDTGGRTISSTKHALSVLLLALICFTASGSSLTRLPDDEMEALKKIAATLGKTDWNFGVDPCSGAWNWAIPNATKEFMSNVSCNCSYNNGSVCHITSIVLQGQSLQGMLPPEMARLRHLQEIDFSRNYLNGTIPNEWVTLPLVNLSLLGNRFSGEVPPWIGNITTLVNLTLEANQFTGPLPPELGNLKNLEKIQFSSNSFSGGLPETFTRLSNLKDFRINDNRFTGRIPELIQNWTHLERLEIQASGFDGPIPSGIFLFKNLTNLRISDINGTMTFPQLWEMKNIKTLILRNCNISGSILPLIGNLANLKHLDLSFNKLTGTIPETFTYLQKMKFMFLTGNDLSGPVPDWMFNRKTHIDLSYNGFTWEGHDSDSLCQQRTLNLLGSSYRKNNQSQVVPCLDTVTSRCDGQRRSLYINCGGDSVTINGTIYEADNDQSSASRFYSTNNWAFSSTGEFMDNDLDDDQYIETANNLSLSMPNSDLYKNARLSPLSLTYYGFCLINGDYSVTLHFIEIIITDDKTFGSLGKRIFDVYIQGEIVLKNFNIKDEASGSGKAVVRKFNATVSNNTLAIHFYWAGNGTTSIPSRGTYGPLVSAIQIESKSRPSSGPRPGVIVGIVLPVLCLVTLVLIVLWKKGFLRGKSSRERDLRGLDLQTGSFTLRQIKAATNNFNAANKIGEGGFGTVYKGVLSDGTFIAVKQLSSKSKQGNREFVTEIGMISALQHPNLVKLYGCCIEGNELLLVYEYMENNSLARALFGPEKFQLKLDWPTRHKICVGIGKGLAYLHEESRLKIVHRDIKATNILLDNDLNPKISDFGLAKLDEDNTHISTRIAGTIGYMAPEYASRGYLTEKADVYSFGVVALEIVSGKSITSYKSGDGMHVLDLAYDLQERGQLLELVDTRLGMEFNKEEATTMINVALACANASPKLRPSMSAVVSMLSGHVGVPVLMPDSTLPGCDPECENSGGSCEQILSQEHSQTQSLLVKGILNDSTTSGSDLYPIHIESSYWIRKD